MAGAIVGTKTPDPRQELIAATAQISRLEGQIEEFRQQAKKLRSEESRVSTGRDEALSQIIQLEGQIEEFRRQARELRSEQSRATAERDEALSQIPQYQIQIEEFRQQVEELQSEQSRVTAERDEALSQIPQYQAQIEEFRQQVKKLRSGESRVTAERDEALSQVLQVEGQIEEFRQQVKRLRLEQSRVTAERDEALSQIQQIAPELEAAHEHIRGYEQAVDSLQQQVRQSESDLADARQQLADTQEERTVGLREIQGLEQRVAAQSQELKSLQAEHKAAASKVGALTVDLAKVRETLVSTEHTGESLRAEIADLQKERDSLRRSVSESGLGQELVAVREQLAIAEKECKRLSLHSRQLTSDVEAVEKTRNERDDLIRTLKTELDNARRSAVTNSEAKNSHDNEVLRGIIARQNSELEQKHAQLKRLRRARLGVQLAYALFAVALAGIFILAIKFVPNLNPSKFLNP